DVRATPEHGSGQVRDGEPRNAPSEVRGDRQEALADEDQQHRQPQALVTEVLSLEDRLREVEQAEQHRVEDQDPGGKANRVVRVRRRAEPDGRLPREYPT